MFFRRIGMLVAVVLMMCVGLAEAARPKYDKPGSEDHPMFSRLSGYYIDQYRVTEFDRGTFYDGNTKVNVEGKTYKITYRTEEKNPERSVLQILRNYSNAFTQIGGRVIRENRSDIHMVLRKDGAEVWVKVSTPPNRRAITLLIVERGEMKQELSARDIYDGLERDGHVALYINFDTGRATIRSESNGILDEVAGMLKKNRRLRVRVEGHTDNTGDPAGNQRLSEMRANAVKRALEQRGISSGRMEAAGMGRDKPVADNSTDGGRAKNRRVELVRID